MKTWSCIESAAFDLHLQEECGIPAILLMENAGAALATAGGGGLSGGVISGGTT